MSGRKRKKELFGGEERTLEDASESVEHVLRVNRKYAERYDVAKRKQDLSKLKEKFGDEIDEGSSSESEDEQGELLTADVDKHIFEVIRSIKKKDPEIYRPEKRFFDDASEENPSKKRKKSKEKVVRPKDFVREEILRKVQEEDNDGESIVASDSDSRPFHEQQQEMRNEFISKAGEMEKTVGDDDLLVLRKKRDDSSTDVSDSLKREIDAVFEDETEENEQFLKQFFAGRSWIDRSAINPVPTYDEIVGKKQESAAELDSEEDERMDEKTDEFERKYNFRFEEGGANEVITHARDVDGSVRRKSDKRKEERRKKKERETQEQIRRDEDLKRLKNLQMKEVEEKAEELSLVLGKPVDIRKFDLEGDYDEEQFDEAMNAVLDDDFFDERDDGFHPEDEEGEDRPEFYPSFFEKGGLSAAFSPQVHVERQLENRSDHDDVEEEREKPLTKSERTKKMKELKEQFSQAMEQYYSMDYEDLIAGDVPTRFRYRRITPRTFNLSIDEILDLPDRELNQRASMKKYAPFRTEKDRKRDWRKEHPQGERKKGEKSERRKKESTVSEDSISRSRVASYFSGSKKEREAKEKRR